MQGQNIFFLQVHSTFNFLLQLLSSKSPKSRIYSFKATACDVIDLVYLSIEITVFLERVPGEGFQFLLLLDGKNAACPIEVGFPQHLGAGIIVAQISDECSKLDYFGGTVFAGKSAGVRTCQRLFNF